MMTKIVNWLQGHYGYVIAAIVGIVLGMTLEQGTCKAIVEWLIHVVVTIYTNFQNDVIHSDVFNNIPQPSLAVVSLGYLCTRRAKKGTYLKSESLNEFVKNQQRVYLIFATQATLDRADLRTEQNRKNFSRNWSWVRNEIGRTILYMELLGFNRDAIAIICQLFHEEWLEVQAYTKRLAPGYEIPLNGRVSDWQRIASDAERISGKRSRIAKSVKPKK